MQQNIMVLAFISIYDYKFFNVYGLFKYIL